MLKKQTGFTIVELLIVIVVIGILATITIVAFNGVQQRAQATSVRSDLANMAKKLEVLRIESATSTYPTSLSASMGLMATKGSYDPTQNNFYYCLNRLTDKYAVGARLKSGGAYLLTESGVQERSNIYGSDTCTAVGTTWGGADTTSLVGYVYSSGVGTWQTWVNG